MNVWSEEATENVCVVFSFLSWWESLQSAPEASSEFSPPPKKPRERAIIMLILIRLKH